MGANGLSDPRADETPILPRQTDLNGIVVDVLHAARHIGGG